MPAPQGARGPEPPAIGTLGMVFGRRKDGAAREDEDEDTDDPPESGAAEAELPPIPSALEREGQAEEDEEEDEMAADNPEAPESIVEVVDDDEEGTEPDLSSWSAAAPIPEGTSQGEETAAEPWSAAADADDGGDTFAPAVLEESTADSEGGLGWLQPDAEQPAPWSAADDKGSAEDPAFDAPVGVVASADAEVEEISAETPIEDLGSSEPSGLDSVTEGVGADEPWAVAVGTPVAPLGPAVYQAPSPVAEYHPAEIALQESRSFPLPEGEVVFRNLRAGFTDPARLLRHLAAEGHTGVLHVLGVDGSNGYVVLVDGYVVAVANDRQGSLTTTNRITFPNFPNSQDTLNVISYSRQIARGLGLLLHAPVRFAGLGAMFVNLEGLRSYLSKHSSSGGLVVHAQDGTGVALFEDGKLVGGYADNSAPTNDLNQLKELVKNLEAEIDVRFGGPKELDPIPLDTLLSGYPL
ncbi:MAG: hypothetical protein ACREN4_03455 [Candidatus Dormibacteria bacterium]